MLPESIPPARFTNKIVAVGLLLLAPVPLLPVFGTLYYDGIGHVFDWPWIFYVFLGVGLWMVVMATRLLIGPQRVGAEVAFSQDGFELEVRAFARRDRRHSIAWVDIEAMVRVDAPRGGDMVAFRLRPDAAVRAGLIQPTTEPDGWGVKARREVKLPNRLTAIGQGEMTARFHRAAEHAGMRLVESASTNLVLYARKEWQVEPA
ncbi:MAG: hypothetical protein AAGA06_09135 [Pseudomonadota bacterium]